MTKYIRNFCIIAHIDHGKSTFSDRIIEICTKKKLAKNQQRILDNMDLEKEKGITIKAQCVNLKFNYKNKIYKLNLIDTPGHIDFSYEVSKSLYICEGAILLIDITQGIQSQTLNNYNIAKKLKLKILIIINKIDIKNIKIKTIIKQIKKKLNYKKKIFLCSSKTGYGIKKIIKNIIKIIPCPKLNINKPLLAIIIDSYFDNYLGAFLLIKIKRGVLKLNDTIKIFNIKKKYNIEKIIINIPNKKNIKILNCGEVGWITCKIKKIKKNLIGSLIYNNNNKINNKKIIKQVKPQIFASIYPKKNNDFNHLKKSLQKLQLNDPSLTYEIEKSIILGSGFKCGFLGILHIEIIKERLKREYNSNINIINPIVNFKIKTKNNKYIYINNADKIDLIKNIKYIKEPVVICYIKSNNKYLSNIISICNKKRGKLKNYKYINKNNNISLKYKIPLLEIITSLSNELKSITQGYCSYNYKFYKYKKSDIIIFKIAINNKIINGLSKFIHKNNLKTESNRVINIIKKYINKQLFNITIQILCNNKIIYRTNIKALRKNVISKCYGGDISRKKKLLKKQKLGKKKMKNIGHVYINNKIFSKILKFN